MQKASGETWTHGQKLCTKPNDGICKEFRKVDGRDQQEDGPGGELRQRSGQGPFRAEAQRCAALLRDPRHPAVRILPGGGPHPRHAAGLLLRPGPHPFPGPPAPAIHR